MINHADIVQKIKIKAKQLGFLDAHIAPTTLSPEHTIALQSWLDKRFYGDMAYFPKHGLNRLNAPYI
jgi:epoxyqueuosine reductase